MNGQVRLSFETKEEAVGYAERHGIAFRLHEPQDAPLILKAYADKIAAKVRGNIILPPGVSGDPVALFYVDQLPDGSVIEVRLKRSTGNAQLDAAIERAIQKSSPLPKPDRSELFQRTLNFEFYPLRD